ncbi:BlaR1 family beta-lactam sensor/signal transducer [Peribacillus sp. JNUCC41]|uniref:BlaR1 family beta-lactam sensor/signal transducer n=1 Tax=Peribacillus sp. JNUCC41 TaxID=2778370 RepID=UPI0017855001|nr:BlaR1 family beta-lactam sensor/signal transducer [Brevibacillus sp. JNUCC-41]QOS92601.1 BlaR1 family beta-lactam sensor/signal transducer [Brevibacillus sp. JNUCC-41]
MYLTHFIIGLLVSSFSVAVILLIRKWFGRRLTAKWYYHLWMFLFMALALPFIPTDLYNFSTLFSGGDTYQANAPSSNMNMTGTDMMQGLHLIQDFSVSVNRPDLSLLNIGVMGLWMSGMLLFTFTMIRGWLTLRRIKNYSSPFSNQEALVLFEECKKRLQIKKSIKIVISKRVQSPMIFGLFQTYIVLPSQHEDWLSLKNYEYIFLHELSHYKNKDLLTNYVILFYQIIYWFNPLVWLAFREMRLDREIACDASVLQLLDDHSFSEYGNTIINFLDLSKRSSKLQMVTQLNGSKLQIKKRIERISAYEHSTKKSIRKSVFIYVLASIILTIQLPFVSAFTTENDRYHFNNDGVVSEDLHQFFKGYEGSFVLYDHAAQQYRIYNEEKSTLRVSPDSTYKIYSALFALESNVISPEESTLSWDGTDQPYDAWNMDHDVSSALQNSVNWYFQALDRKTGFETIQSNLQAINYGNSDVSGGLGEFWLESSLKISPVEQVQLLQAFYYNQLGYKKLHSQTVKEALLLEKNEEASLSGKTGTGTVNGKNINGWFIGYVETKNNTYFFATNIQNEDDSSGSKAGEITLSILKDLGIYQENGGEKNGEKHS